MNNEITQISSCKIVFGENKQVLITRVYLIYVLLFGIAFLGQSQTVKGQMSLREQAGKLLSKKDYKRAIPLLEKMLVKGPNDEEVFYGLGVALFMDSVSIKDTEKQKRQIVHARQSLLRAKEAGIEEDDLEDMLKALPVDGNAEKNESFAKLVFLTSMYPPKIFSDNDLPGAIQLIEGYKHKSSGDFEGGNSGIIYKPRGLKIRYETGFTQGQAVKAEDKDQYTWYEESTINETIFRCAIKKDGQFVVTIPLDEIPNTAFAINFYAYPKSQSEIDEMKQMVFSYKK